MREALPALYHAGMSKLFRPILLLTALLTVATTGCKFDPSGQPGTLENAKAPPDWKPYEANLAQRALFNITTQYVEKVVEVVKWQTNKEVQVVTNVIEKAVPVPVYNGWLTNTIVVTNIDTQLVERLTSQISSITNHIADHIDVELKKGVQTIASGVKAVPVYGDIMGYGIAAIGALFAGYTQRKLNESNEIKKRLENESLVVGVDRDAHSNAVDSLTQTTEVALELMKNLATTAQGQQALKAYKEYLVKHQTASGVIGLVSTAVASEVDNQSAKFVASVLANGEVPNVS